MADFGPFRAPGYATAESQANLRRGAESLVRTAVSQLVTASGDVGSFLTYDPIVGRQVVAAREVYRRRAMCEPIAWVSTCPRCIRKQSQEGFTVADLVRLFDGGFPIEAYCVICDEFWSINLQERVALGAAITAACEGTCYRQANQRDRTGLERPLSGKLKPRPK
jgi:hypothetical protein